MTQSVVSYDNHVVGVWGNKAETEIKSFYFDLIFI